ncbi:MAG: hypothetical protein NDJ18_07440, partial [candidate division Zixibacteria bacterium]|nr:hypothetical protein [candidate division Zixibacteria bacterium]
ARLPELRSRPKRTLIVGGTLLFSLLFSIMLAAIFEYLDRLRENQPLDYEKAMYVAGAFFGWIPGVRRTGPVSSHSKGSKEP